MKKILTIAIGLCICVTSFAKGTESVEWKIQNNFEYQGKKITVKHDGDETINLNITPKNFEIGGGTSKTFSESEVEANQFNEMSITQTVNQKLGQWAFRFINGGQALDVPIIGEGLAITYSNTTHEIFLCSSEDYAIHKGTCRYTEGEKQTSKNIHSDFNLKH